MTRYAWLVVLGCMGCRGLWPGENPAVGADPPTVLGESQPNKAAVHQADEQMELASAAFEAGDDGTAARHLGRYVSQRPDHLIARAQLAELLYREGKRHEARLHFEAFIAQAQEHQDRAFRFLIHSHSRLVDIAEADEDVYEEHLQRGIGLYLLACRRAQESDPQGEHSTDSLLCRAVSEFQEARALEPDEARPHLYLHLIWARLGQHGPALRALHSADHQAALSRLTPVEQRELQTACLREAHRLASAVR